MNEAIESTLDSSYTGGRSAETTFLAIHYLHYLLYQVVPL